MSPPYGRSGHHSGTVFDDDIHPMLTITHKAINASWTLLPAVCDSCLLNLTGGQDKYPGVRLSQLFRKIVGIGHVIDPLVQIPVEIEEGAVLP